VTVGTHYQGFERLIKAVDELVGKDKIKENVIIQIGHSDYIPKNCKWFRFVDPENFIKFCKESNIVITHGGIGSIVIPLKLEKPVIVVPRYKKFFEHTDDHQIEISKVMGKEGKVIPVYDIKDLEFAIEKTRKLKVKKREKKKSKIFGIISEKLQEWENQ